MYRCLFLKPNFTEIQIVGQIKTDKLLLLIHILRAGHLVFINLSKIFNRARPSIKDCFNNSWLQDAYLMRLRRQTLTFTTTRLKEFLADQQRRRQDVATKHKVLLRSYQSSPQTPTSPATPNVPTTPTAPTTPVTQ